ncbi:uncharacterized protein LAESUDRAFT_29513 [Laetiporus sulphureus 93-53]|uniref:Uncharacterized protein n=1 Tax=Laetiporus sulphureus 93-53 TaxID=1314785 RepID=A0A165IHV2_9APHY|nr:uncharacterized protein LAESUDRAFT_29513 [Laetiporus sulphureus 93-53]KZT13096.1 hypothetical protein LAESUDRAFT_29513 [Laetiporus sulphureus 93-53]
MQRNLARISSASAATPKAKSITETALRVTTAHSSCDSELQSVVVTCAAAAALSASILPICALTITEDESVCSRTQLRKPVCAVRSSRQLDISRNALTTSVKISCEMRCGMRVI